jgi:hypothetical protein
MRLFLTTSFPGEDPDTVTLMLSTNGDAVRTTVQEGRELHLCPFALCKSTSYSASPSTDCQTYRTDFTASIFGLDKAFYLQGSAHLRQDGLCSTDGVLPRETHSQATSPLQNWHQWNRLTTTPRVTPRIHLPSRNSCMESRVTCPGLGTDDA